MSKILIVDGNSLMFRAYFATSYTGNLMQTSTGLYTNAVFGFVNMMNKLLQAKPDYCFVAFDAGKKTFRHQAYDDYKGGRKPTPPEFKVQIPYIKKYLDRIHIRHEEMLDFEADDLVATVSELALKNNVNEIMVVSGDKDLLQLVRDNVHVCLTKKGITELEEYTIDNFFDKMGFLPSQIPDYKGLVGDTSDNLPGIKGIGEKTALKLLTEFKSLENIVQNSSLIPGKTGQTIAAGATTGLTCKKLATLVLDIPLNFSLEDIKVVDYDKNMLIDFYKELEFKSFITKFNQDGNNESELNEKASEDNISSQLLKINESFSDINTLDYEDAKKQELFILPEVFGFNYYNGTLLGLAIKSNNKNYFVSKEELLWNINLQELLLNHNNIVTYDFKMLYVVLNRLGLTINKAKFDLLLAIYLIDPRKTKDDFKETLSDYLKYEVASYSDVYGKGVKEAIPSCEVYQQYALSKLFIVSQVKSDIGEIIKQEQLEFLFDCEIGLSKVLGDMELTGLIVSTTSLDQANIELTQKQKEYEERIYELAGCEFNINSPKQLGEILFERLALPSGKKNKNGYSTDSSILEYLSKEYEIARVVLDYRKVTKIISTYINGLFGVMDNNHYIHPLYKQALTVTGRLSSVEPNIQNMPIRDDVGKVIRSAFVSRFKNGKIVSLDYSQIELRVLSSMSKDTNMIQAFNSDVDFHRATAAWIFDKTPEEVTSHERSSAKAINFGIVYGMSAWGLSESIGISPKEAKSYIEKYFMNYPGIDAFIKNTINQAKMDGFTKTYFGRKRYIPELKSMNKTIYQFGERTAVNSPIQGTAADIIKLAMVKVGEFLESGCFQSKLIAQVHDELVFDCVENEIDALIQGVKNIMESVVEMDVKLIASSEVGNNWMEA